MENAMQKTAEISAEQGKICFNFNKLQAVACMAASAIASIGLIAWVLRAIL